MEPKFYSLDCSVNNLWIFFIDETVVIFDVIQKNNHELILLNNDLIFGYPSYLNINAPLNLPVGRLIGYNGGKNDPLKYFGSTECLYVDEISGFIYMKGNENCPSKNDGCCLEAISHFSPFVCDSENFCSKKYNAVIVPISPEHIISVKVFVRSSV